MTTACPTQAAETVELSENHGNVYLTGREIAAIEDDPVLSLLDVIAHRAGGDRA